MVGASACTPSIRRCASTSHADCTAPWEEVRMRWSLLSLVLLAGCATGRSHGQDEQLAARISEAETAVTRAREERDAAMRFLEVATAEDQAAWSQLRARPPDRPLELRARASQAKREYAQKL